MFDLRPYQEACVKAVREKWYDFRKVLMILPTGSGKTICFSKLIADCVEQGMRCLILAHRDELIQQAVDKLKRSTGLDAAIEKAGASALDSIFKVTVGSVQSLCREKRLHAFSKSHYDVIIVDEAHHVLADTYQRILDWFDEALVLGCTATPDRGDKKNLGSFFDCIGYEYGLRDAITEGFLCPIVTQTCPIDIDLTQVKVTRGDFNDRDLGDALTPYLQEISVKMGEFLSDRKTLTFLPLIATSQDMTGRLLTQGFQAQHIDGKSKDRREILAGFGDSQYNALQNAMLLTEGYDEPSITSVVVLRPTKSRPLYAQMVGRGTRIHPGKENLLLLDFLWHHERHSLCKAASLVAKTEAVAKKMEEQAANAGFGGPIDLLGLEGMAMDSIRNDRESTLARYLDQNKKRKAKTVDPVWFGLSMRDDEIVDYEPVFAWEKEKVSEKQANVLNRAGFDGDNMTRGFASKILTRLFARREEGLATPKMVSQLEKRGYPHSERLTFEQARDLMDQAANSGWTKRWD